MPSRFFTIQFRLVLGFALVLGLALFSVSWYVGSVAQSEVERFERRDPGAAVDEQRENMGGSKGGGGAVQSAPTIAGGERERWE